MTAPELLAFHRELVSIPSVTKSEQAAIDFADAALSSAGLATFRIGRNLVAKTPGPVRLLLNSHLDTVPATPEWSRPPHPAVAEEGRVYGLGSNDAKGAAAAMVACLQRCKDLPGLGLLLVVDEETGGEGTEVAWPHLRDELKWAPEGVIVGEPTEMQIGIGQRGLLILELVATGTPCHAANAAILGVENPVYQLARDLAILEQLELPGGDSRVTPTMLHGAAAKNQVAGEAKAFLDIRTRPGQDHEQIIQTISAAVSGEVRVTSRRLVPYGCDPESRIVRTAERAVPNSKTFESRTMSDQVFFVGLSAIKMGPGVSVRSHTADEYILESEILHGAAGYEAIAREFLA